MAQVGALPVGETGAGNRPGEPGAGVLGVHAKANEGQFLFFPCYLLSGLFTPHCGNIINQSR